MSPFLSDCPSLMLGMAIHCIQHSQAMLERGVCELAHSFFHYPKKFDVNFINTFLIHFYNHMEKNYCIIVYFETLNFLQGALPFVIFI